MLGQQSEDGLCVLTSENMCGHLYHECVRSSPCLVGTQCLCGKQTNDRNSNNKKLLDAFLQIGKENPPWLSPSMTWLLHCFPLETLGDLGCISHELCIWGWGGGRLWSRIFVHCCRPDLYCAQPFTAGSFEKARFYRNFEGVRAHTE